MILAYPMKRTEERRANYIWVSGWLLFNTKAAIFLLYQVNLQWKDDEVRFVLDQQAELDFYNASLLEQQSTDKYIAPLGHIILNPSQPVFAPSA